MKQIIITVDDGGSMSVEAFGFKGKSCEQTTQKLIAELGKVKQQKKKPEYYAQEQLKQRA
jgi:hypothetical protein